MKALTGKKFLSLLLSVLMCLSLMPLSAFADGETTSNAAKIGDTVYATLEEAIAAAKDGDTVTLLANIKDTGKIILPANVTFDGAGKTLSGNSSISVNKAGGTVKNTVFKDIHDDTVVSDANKKKYGFSDDKVGTLAAVYSPLISGKLVIEGCTFENIDWDALQITPAEGADITIINNTFKVSVSETVKEQLRHIHVEMAYGTGFDYEGTDIKLTVTDNKMFGETKNACMGIWWVGKNSTLELTGNYYDNPETASITLSDKTFNRENRNDLIYPARSKAEENVDDLTTTALVIKDAFNSTSHNSLAEAVAAAKDGETVKLVSNTDMSNSGAITVKANITLDLNGNTLKMSNTNKGSILIKNATFTLKDSTDTAKNGTGTGKIYTETAYDGTADTTKCLIEADDNGHFVMESGLIDAASFTDDHANIGQFAVGVFNTTKNTTASLTVNGGHIKAGWYALAGNGGANNGTGNITVNGGIIESVADYAIYHPQNGTTTVNGGTVYGAAGGISLNRGKLIVNGGTITSKGTGSTGNWGDGTGGQNAAAINVNAGYGDADAQITGGKITAEKDAILLGTGANHKATIAVSGGTFSSAVLPEYCADGFIPAQNADGTYGVKSGSYVAEVNGEKYESLAEAIKAANNSDIIKLLVDIKDSGEITLPANVTLDGAGHKITGNSCVRVNTAGGSIKNVLFENIHNSTVVSSENCEKYGWSDKIGSLSAVYSAGLTGTLSITGCTFDNVDWDAVQIIEPSANSTINITDNIFKHTDISKTQLRYIHIECAAVNYASKYTKLNINITDNQMFDSKQNDSFASITAYYVSSASTIKVDGNYVEDPASIDISKYTGINDLKKYYPMRSQADIDSDDKEFPFVICVEIDGIKKYYETADKAAAAAKSTDKQVKITLLADITVSSPFDLSYLPKSTSLEINGFTLRGNGCTALIIGSETSVVNIYGPGSIISENGIAVEATNNKSTTISGKPATVTGNIVNSGSGVLKLALGNYKGEIINSGNGSITITGGTYTADPTAYLADGYTTEKDGDIWTVVLMTDEQAVAAGYTVRKGAATSSTRKYYKNINDASFSSAAVYLLVDAENWNVDKSYSSFTIDGNGHNFTGNIIGKGKITLRNGTFNLTSIVTGTGSTHGLVVYADVTVAGGNVKLIDVRAGGKLTLTGGTYSGTIKVNNTGKLSISGGTFSNDPTEYTADGYKAVKNSDGTYGVIGLTIIRNMVLENSLTMTYTVTPGEYSIKKGVYSFYSDTQKKYVDTTVYPVNNGDGTYSLNFNGINPQRMMDGLKLTIFLEKDGDTFECALPETTVKDYLVWVLKNHENYKEVISNLVEYGAAAQIHMNYRTDELVTAAVKEAGVALETKSYMDSIDGFKGKSKVERVSGGINIVERQVILYDSVHVRIYFELEDSTSINDVSFEAVVKRTDGTNVREATKFDVNNITKEGNRYYIEFTDVMATELDNEIIFTSYVNETENDKYSYYVNDSLASLSKSSGYEKIAEALFNYGCSCNNFKG